MNVRGKKKKERKKERKKRRRKKKDWGWKKMMLGGDKSPLAGGPHYLLTSPGGVEGCVGVRQSNTRTEREGGRKNEVQLKRGRWGSDGGESWRLRVVSDELERERERDERRERWRGEWEAVIREERRLLRLLLLLFSQTDERPARWAPRCRDVILKPNMSCAGACHVMWLRAHGASDWVWQKGGQRCPELHRAAPRRRSGSGELQGQEGWRRLGRHAGTYIKSQQAGDQDSGAADRVQLVSCVM